MSNEKIAKALAELKSQNYSQVSISELGHRLGMPIGEVTTHLRTIRAKTIVLRGEKYVVLDACASMLDKRQRLAPRVSFSDFTLKSSIYEVD